jgi:hypothetical protein
MHEVCLVSSTEHTIYMINQDILSFSTVFKYYVGWHIILSGHIKLH